MHGYTNSFACLFLRCRSTYAWLRKPNSGLRLLQVLTGHRQQLLVWFSGWCNRLRRPYWLAASTLNAMFWSSESEDMTITSALGGMTTGSLGLFLASLRFFLFPLAGWLSDASSFASSSRARFLDGGGTCTFPPPSSLSLCSAWSRASSARLIFWEIWNNACASASLPSPSLIF